MDKISIVTPSFNQGDYIEQTIQSVLSQNYPNLEYIIIDGGSTDNSLEIIKKYEKYLTFWRSEKDNGQADAINKGLKYCTGTIFNWLNSDDYLEPGALFVIADKFKSGADMVAGKVRIFQDEKTIEIVQHKNLSAESLMFWQNGIKFVQPGVWLKRDLIENCGGIDKTFNYCFDWDLYIRYLSIIKKIEYSDSILIHFRYHSNSKTITQLPKFIEEENIILEKLSCQKELISVKKLALRRLSARKWVKHLDILKNKSGSKFEKVYSIIQNTNKVNIVFWRTTMGMIRRILFND